MEKDQQKDTNVQDLSKALPTELALHVLSFVPLAHLGSVVPQVSKAWRQLAEDDSLWRHPLAALWSNAQSRPYHLPTLEGFADNEGLTKAQVKDLLLCDPLRDLRFSTEVSESASSTNTHLRVVVLGSGGVGKSALTISFTLRQTFPEYDPTLEDSYRRVCQINDVMVVLEVLDTAGPEEFSAVRDQWICQANAFMMVYDVTNSQTFEELERFWQGTVLRLKAKDEITAILVGNKVDLVDQMVPLGKSREVAIKQGAALAQSWSQGLGGRPVPFLETSAKLLFNIEPAFCGVAFLELKRLGLLDSQAGATQAASGKKKSKPTKCSLLM